MVPSKRSNFRIAIVAGVPVYIEYLWLVIYGLIIWSFAVGVIPSILPASSVMVRLLASVAVTTLFFVSVVAHEFGHVLAARQCGIATTRVMLFLFGGVAELASEPRTPRHEFFITLAGPVVSLLLAGAFWLLARFGAGDVPVVVGSALLLATLNQIMGLFNLIPGFPLDGGRLLRSLLWALTKNYQRATIGAAAIGQVLALMMMFLGVVNLFAGGFAHGIWYILLGSFLNTAALQSRRHARVRQVLEVVRVREVLDPNPRSIWHQNPHLTLTNRVIVHVDDSVESALKAMEKNAVAIVPVVEENKLVGLVTERYILDYLKTHGLTV